MLFVCAGKHITKPLKVEPEPQLPLSVYPLELKCDAGDHCHLLKDLSVCYECQETENLPIYHECQETDIHKDEQISFTYGSWASEEVIWGPMASEQHRRRNSWGSLSSQNKRENDKIGILLSANIPERI